ncbi:hypothetical protein ACFVHQ_04750, partial [Actinomycetes bacterium NPDC127524]
MKKPWINHSYMEEICSKQMIVFICINEDRTEIGKDICELDTSPGCVNTITTNNSQEDDYINKVNHSDNTHNLHELSVGIDSKHVSKIDDCTETDNVLKKADSTDCKHNFKTKSSVKENVKAQTDFIDLQHPSKSDFMSEMKELLDKGEVSEPYTVDETNDTLQIDPAFELQHLSENDLINEMNNTAQTDFAFELQHPSESDFMNEMKDLLEKEEMDEPLPTDEIEEAIEPQYPSESDVDYEINELPDKEEVDEPYPADETRESPQSKAIFE